VKIPTKADGNEASPFRNIRGWRLCLLIVLVLIPIPFSPWWVGIIGLGVFGLLMWLFVATKKKPAPPQHTLARNDETLVH
jgi:hypothetical protein